MFVINEFAVSLSKLPGIGKKSAMRLAYFFLKNRDKAMEISNAITDTISSIKSCSPKTVRDSSLL